MAYRQYIGSRYVPIFGRKGENTYEWDNSAPYEPLTVVMHQGNSFTSIQYVPTGIDINNRKYWAETGNWNAQVEAYRAEVRTFNDRIEANTRNIATIDEDSWVTENRIADGAVTSGKIADGNVTTGKIVDNAVTTPKIADGAVTSDKISPAIFKSYMGFFSPEQFGAIGDGVTDDTQAFKDMLVAMYDGSVCVLQSKNYLITDTLTINVNMARFTSFERSESTPCIKFDFNDFTDKHCIDCYGTGNTFSNIHVRQESNEVRSCMFYIDGVNNNYNVDYTFDGCVFSNAWNCFEIIGRNVHITNCLISTIMATSITIKQPNYATPLRGFVFENNRFHIAGMLVNTAELTDYSETFNLALVNNMVDFSKRLYLGISDNVNISGNTVAQTTIQADYLVLFNKTVNRDSCAYVSNNMVSTLGSPTNQAIAGLYSHTTDVQGIINITGNMFDTVYSGGRGCIVTPNTSNNVVILIAGNTIHTKGSGTPIQIVNVATVQGLISGNTITTKNSEYFISAAGLTIGDNFTANVII